MILDLSTVHTLMICAFILTWVASGAAVVIATGFKADPSMRDRMFIVRWLYALLLVVGWPRLVVRFGKGK